jgi:anti-anti-sigma factor
VEPTVLRLEGSVDVRVAKRFRDSARDHANAGGPIVVDCSAVARFDASAVQILLALKARVEAKGEAFVMQSVPERVLTLLELTGAARALGIREAAAGPLSEGGPS